MKLNIEKSLIYEWSSSFEFIYTGKTVQTSKNTKIIINETWNNLISQNAHLFNGSVISLDKITKYGQKIRLHFAKTDYAHFLASEKNMIFTKQMCRSLYVSVLILLNDNSVAFGEMGRYSFEPGRFQFIGGGVDESYAKENTLDFFSCAANELHEEAGIDIKECGYTLTPLFLSFEKDTCRLSCIYKLHIPLSSIELSILLQKHNEKLKHQEKGIEVKKFLFVNKKNYASILNTIQNKKIDKNLASSLNAFFTEKTEDHFSLKI